MKLRRESVGIHCKTTFQNKLCDVLYEGSSIPNNFFMNEDGLAFLKDEIDDFLKVAIILKFLKKRIFNSGSGLKPRST